MEIQVKNYTALRLAVACLSNGKGDARPWRFARITPDGAITGSDGYRLAYHPHAVEPYEGPTFYIRPERALSVAQGRVVTIDTEAKVLIINGKRTLCEMFLETRDDFYPDVTKVFPDRPMTWEPTVIGWDTAYAHDFGKILDHQVYWQLAKRGENGPPLLLAVTGDPDQLAMLVPLRFKDEWGPATEQRFIETSGLGSVMPDTDESQEEAA